MVLGSFTCDEINSVAYLQACKEGNVYNQFVRIMVTGSFGDGKTSLIQRLLRNDIPRLHIPTDALDAQSCKIDITKCDGEWNEVQDDTKEIIHQELRTSMAKDIYSRKEAMKRRRSFDDIENIEREVRADASSRMLVAGYPMLDGIEELCQVLSRTHRYWKLDKTQREELSLDETQREELSQLRSRDLVESKSRAIIYLWDFGGQDDYSYIHPVFIRAHCVPLVVFDLHKYENEKKKELTKIEFWLQMILANHLVENPRNPSEEEKIIIVGTHADLLKGKNSKERAASAKNLIESLYDSLTGKQYKNFIKCILHVDSKNGDPENYGELRKCLMSTARALPSWTEEHPIRYLRLLNKLYDVETQEKHGMMTLENVMKYADECNIKSRDEVKHFLEYHHAKGDLTYFPSPEVEGFVVVDAQFLAKLFREVITIDRYYKNKQRVKKKDLDKLRKEALIEKDGSLWADLWRKFLFGTEDERVKQVNHLKQLMVKFDLLMEHGQKYYLIPCLLRKNDTFDPPDAMSTTLYLRFHATKESAEDFLDGHDTFYDYFLPPALFHQLICRLSSARETGWTRDSRYTMRNLFRFYKGNQDITLATNQTGHWIRISLANRTDAANILEQINTKLNQILMAYYKNIWVEYCLNPCQAYGHETEDCIISSGRTSIGEMERRVSCGIHPYQLKTTDYKFWFGE